MYLPTKDTLQKRSEIDLFHDVYAIFSDFLYKGICCGDSFELHRQVDAIQMSTHNICFYKEVKQKYTGCNLKTTEFHKCALLGVCAVIRSNTVLYLALWDSCTARSLHFLCIFTYVWTAPCAKRVFGHMRAVWSGPLPSANRLIGYYSEPSLQRQHLFPKTLPFKRIFAVVQNIKWTDWYVRKVLFCSYFLS